MKSRLAFLFLCAVCAVTALPTRAYARQRYQGYCQQGGIQASTSGVNVSPKLVGSYPGCQVQVFLTGSTIPATIYADNSGTTKSYTFTADATTGYWYFYADPGRYDVRLSGGGIASPVTVTDLPSIPSGYDLTAGSGLTLNVSNGQAWCAGTLVTYAGGTLSMTPSTTNYVYLNTVSSCVPTSGTSLPSASIPIGQVVAGSSLISSIVQFSSLPGASSVMTVGSPVTSGVSGLGFDVDASGNLAQPGATYYVNGYAGATADVKTAACLSAASAVAGTCDASALTSPTFAALVTVPANTGLILPRQQISCSVVPCLKWSSYDTIKGQGNGRNSSTVGTRFVYTGAQLSNAYAVAAAPTGLSRDTNGTITITFASALPFTPSANTTILLEDPDVGAGGSAFAGPKKVLPYVICAASWGVGCADPTSSAITVIGTINATPNANTVADTSGSGVVVFETGLLASNGSSFKPVMSDFAVTRSGYTISTIARSTNIVTVTMASALSVTPLAHQFALVGGVAGGGGFNGSFPVCGPPTCSAPNSTSFQYQQTGSDTSASGSGTVYFSDGLTAYDFGSTYSARVTDLGANLLDVGFLLGGTLAGSYYNDFYSIFSNANVSCQVCNSVYANSNKFYSPVIFPGGDTLDIYMAPTSTDDVFYSVDSEDSSVGLIYIAGRAHSFVAGYVETLSNPPIQLDGNTQFNTILGGIGTSVTDLGNPWNYNLIWTPGASITGPSTPNWSAYPQFFASKYLTPSNTTSMLTQQTTLGTMIASIPRAIGSCSRSTNVTTCVMTGAVAPGYIANFPVGEIGQQITIAGATAAGATTFNGDFNICGPPTTGCATPSATQFSFAQTAADDTSTGGQVDFLSSLDMNSLRLGTPSGGHGRTRLKANAGDSGSNFWLPPANSQTLTLLATGKSQAGDIILAQGSANTPTVAATCVSSCTNTWSYEVVANFGLGTSAASSAGSTTVGAANVDASNTNQIIWASSAGAVSYDVYLTAFPGAATCGGVACATGKIASAVAPGYTAINSFTHSTQNGDSSTAPAINTSGNLQVPGAVSNGVATSTNTDNRGNLTASGGNFSYTFTQGRAGSGAWATAPVCVVSDNSGGSISSKTVSTSALSGTTSGATDSVSYICWPGT